MVKYVQGLRPFGAQVIDQFWKKSGGFVRERRGGLLHPYGGRLVVVDFGWLLILVYDRRRLVCIRYGRSRYSVSYRWSLVVDFWRLWD